MSDDFVELEGLGQIMVPFGHTQPFIDAYRDTVSARKVDGRVYIIDTDISFGFGAFHRDIQVLEGIFLPKPDKYTLVPVFLDKLDSFRKVMNNQIDKHLVVQKGKKTDVRQCPHCQSEKLFMGNFCTVCGK